MKTVYSEEHRKRASKTELFGGELVPPFECPERMDHILAEMKARNLGPILAPEVHGLDPARKIHSADFIDFLATCWRDWSAAGYKGEAIATTWPSRALSRPGIPEEVNARLGYYCLASETAISEGTWEAAQASCNVAMTAQKLVAGGERTAFALCRPPGHHASTDMFGGYCFLNNAAIVAQAFLDDGAGRVAILDVDYHHGNGTQEIFYKRSDVLFLSLHGDPSFEFPYFLGGADETGAGVGEGFNANYPMPAGTPYSVWGAALEEAFTRIKAYAPDVLVVSLGVDTFKLDPISQFKLQSADFTDYGRKIAGLGMPTLFVMEGGYAVAEIGVNTVNVLKGFEGAI